MPDKVWIRYSRCTGKMFAHVSEAEVFENLEPNDNYNPFIEASAVQELVEALEDIESRRVYHDGKPGKTPKTRARQALKKFRGER